MRRFPSISASHRKSALDENNYKPPLELGIVLIFIVMALIIFGSIMLYSTTANAHGFSMLTKQLIWTILGIVIAAGINIVGYNAILPFSKYILALTWLLLIIARMCREVNGAYRWIPLPGGFGNIQPSELAKIAVIMFLAYYIPKNQRRMKSSFKSLIYPGFFCLVTLALVLVGHDLGTTILIAAVIWIMLLVSGIRLKLLIPPVALIPFIFLSLKYISKVRWDRVTSFMNPEVYQKTTGYQLWFSLLALGSGWWTGLGFMKSRMKAQYLPEAHTDFILAIVGEELGFIALVLLICAYVAFFIISLLISMRAKDKEGMMLGFGACTMIALQAIINIGVVSGAFPTKGMPAPFISYGGSNIIVCLICTGFILSIANMKKKEYRKTVSTSLRDF